MLCIASFAKKCWNSLSWSNTGHREVEWAYAVSTAKRSEKKKDIYHPTKSPWPSFTRNMFPKYTVRLRPGSDVTPSVATICRHIFVRIGKVYGIPKKLEEKYRTGRPQHNRLVFVTFLPKLEESILMYRRNRTYKTVFLYHV